MESNFVFHSFSFIHIYIFHEIFMFVFIQNTKIEKPINKFSSLLKFFLCLKILLHFTSPITYAWHGGKILSQQENFLAKCMTREQYEEEGVRGVTEKFAI